MKGQKVVQGQTKRPASKKRRSGKQGNGPWANVFPKPPASGKKRVSRKKKKELKERAKYWP